MPAVPTHNGLHTCRQTLTRFALLDLSGKTSAGMQNPGRPERFEGGVQFLFHGCFLSRPFVRSVSPRSRLLLLPVRCTVRYRCFFGTANKCECSTLLPTSLIIWQKHCRGFPSWLAKGCWTIGYRYLLTTISSADKQHSSCSKIVFGVLCNENGGETCTLSVFGECTATRPKTTEGKWSGRLHFQLSRTVTRDFF